MERIDTKIIDWLLNSNPWTKYKTLTELMYKPLDNQDVIEAKKQLLKEKLLKDLISDTSNWFPESITRHNDPKISHYKLRMLVDFGFTISDPGINEIVKKASQYYQNNLFTIRQEMPEKVFKKPDKNANNWYAMPCDSPILTYIFLKLGNRDEKVMRSVEEIKNKWLDEKGWFCHFFFVEGQYNKLQIGCPMAGLQALEVFSLIPELKESEYAKNAYAPLKYHYESGKSLYYFGQSKKFYTLKYPFVWYNALYVANVLSRFEFTKKEKLVTELANWILNMQDETGKFKASSIFMPYKNWDFGNKKEFSPWITFLCYRILKRLNLD